MSRRNKIIIGVIGLITLITFGGITYAYFSRGDVRGNENEKVVTLTADYGEVIVVYDENEGIINMANTDLKEAEAGTTYTSILKLSIENTGSVSQDVTIKWKDVINDFCEYQSNNSCTNIETDEYVGDEISYNIYECSLTDWTDATSADLKSCTNIGSGSAPRTGEESLLHDDAYLTITEDSIEYYIVGLSIENKETEQNYNQGKSFNGTIDVQLENSYEADINVLVLDENENRVKDAVVTMNSDPVTCTTNENGKCLLKGIVYGSHELSIVDSEGNSLVDEKIEINKTKEESSINDNVIMYSKKNQKDLRVTIGDSITLSLTDHVSEPYLAFQTNLGGNADDFFFSINGKSGQDFIISGYSSSTDITGITNNGAQDAFIIKYNSDNILWQKNWGGSSNDYYYDVAYTDDGGYIVVGTKASSDITDLTHGGYNDGMIVKYDQNGNILWQKSYGGNHNDIFTKVMVEEDGYIVVGAFASKNIEGLSNKATESVYSSDAVVVKYDLNGNILWQKSWGGDTSDFFRSIVKASDGGYILMGYSASNVDDIVNNGHYDGILVKYDEDWNVVWQKNYGDSNASEFRSITNAKDGGYVVVSYNSQINSSGTAITGSYDGLIIKFDKDGNILWQKDYIGNNDDGFEVVISDGDGYVIVGSSDSTDISGITNNGDDDGLILKYDDNGNLLWQKNYGGSGRDIFFDVALNNNGGYMIAAYSNSTDIPNITNKGAYDGLIIQYAFD